MFQNRFAPLVASGQKTQTIRKSARCNPGDVLSLREWTGKPYRSKQRVLREAKATEIHSVVISGQAMFLDMYGLCIERKDILARADGFTNWDEMRDWFEATHGLPFEGELITWK